MRHQPETLEMLVERQLGTRRRVWLRFAPELEQRFEAETAPARSRMLFLQGIAGLAFYLVHSFTDLALIPDVTPLALWLHLGLMTPLSLLAIALFWRNPPPALREFLVIGCGLLAGVITLSLMLLSDSPMRDQLASSTAPILLFIMLVQRVRLPYAVVACLVLCVTNVAALAMLPEYPHERLVSSIGTLAGSAALMLIACWVLEREFRRAYLLRLRERLANSALADMSQHDAMTGLENRRALDLAFAAITRDGHRGEDVAVVLLDIDHFKDYNDSLGHVAGDEALRQVAHELRAGLRAGTDRAFRFGGEEFLVLLRRTSLSEAVTLAERLRRRIEAAAIPHPKAAGRLITGSFGVASARIGGEIDSDELVSGADAALYAAKRAGRNQVWPPLPGPLGSAAEQTEGLRRDAS